MSDKAEAFGSLIGPPPDPLPYKQLHGPGKSNGCCMDCCGALPAPIDPKAIVADGGKFVTLPDGRILEYFVYGSEEKDARVLIQLAGTGGTGKYFTQGDIPSTCLKLNIKGISITYPGHAYSSVNVGRRVIDFVDDVDEVLKVENVDKFMIEGSSYGTPHAMAIAWYYSQRNRILAMHLHVPYLNNEVAREVTPDTLVAKSPVGGTTAGLQESCCAFCCTGFMYCCCIGVCGSCMMSDQDYPGSGKLALDDVRRSAVHSYYGIAFNNLDEHCSENWGFDLREIKLEGPSQVIVSYAGDDEACPPEHGKWLGTFFKAQVNTKKVGVGHLTFATSLLRGEFIDQLVKAVTLSESQTEETAAE